LLPGPGRVVRVFDVHSAAFQDAWGPSNPNPHIYPDIFAAETGEASSCTASGGACGRSVPGAGNYRVTARASQAAGGLFAGRVVAPSDFVHASASVALTIQVTVS